MKTAHNIKELKASLLVEIKKEEELRQGCDVAGDVLQLYHKGHVLAYKDVYDMIVRFIKE